MASDTIPQMAEKIREFAEGLIRDNFATCSPPAPQTYTAEEAWGKMAEGYRVDVVGGGDNPDGVWHMNGASVICDVNDDSIAYPTRAVWLSSEDAYTLHGIHPEAHKHALQRHIAAGMVVGSRVGVVDVDGGGSLGRACIPKYHAGKTRVVEEVLDGDVYLNVTAGGWHYPAHCLRLIQAEPEAAYTPPCDAPDGFEWAGGARVPQEGEYYWNAAANKPTEAAYQTHSTRHILRKLPPPKPEDQVPPATKTAEGGGDAGWKVGDRAWVEVEVRRDAYAENNGNCVVSIDGLTAYCPPSALHPTPPPSPPGSVWWAIDKMRGGAVCERDGLQHRIRDGVLEWFICDEWKGICLVQDDIAATEWRVVEGGSQ